MAIDVKLMTIEEFAAMEAGSDRTELIRGEVSRMPPPGYEHGLIVATIAQLVGSFVRPRKLGVVVDNGGFKFEDHPDTVLAPDVSFISSSRIPDKKAGYPDLRPDLVFEVVSPSDLAVDVNRKVQIYLSSGVRMVCIVWPITRSAELRASDDISRTLGEHELIDFGDVIPGLQFHIEDLFD